MNPVTVDMKDILVAEGIGEWGVTKETVWCIFIGKEPDNPTNTITLYITPGVVQKQYNDNRHFYNSTFQVRVRSVDYELAYKKTMECFEALDRIGSFVVDSNVLYNNVIMEDEPTPLQKDSQGRTIFVINGTAFRRKSV